MAVEALLSPDVDQGGFGRKLSVRQVLWRDIMDQPIILLWSFHLSSSLENQSRLQSLHMKYSSYIKYEGLQSITPIELILWSQNESV